METENLAERVLEMLLVSCTAALHPHLDVLQLRHPHLHLNHLRGEGGVGMLAQGSQLLCLAAEALRLHLQLVLELLLVELRLLQ